MTWIDRFNTIVAAGEPFVSVTVVETTGSVPAEPGAKMLVTSRGRDHGSVGGGIAEHEAIAIATSMLSDASAQPTRFVTWNLVKDLGMTCAGVVRLFFEIYNRQQWTIALFGAGHVANALGQVLVTLDCRIVAVDAREEWLDRMPVSSRVQRVLTDSLASAIPSLPDDAFVLLMTTDHDTDLVVLTEVLCTRSFPYVGVIGSKGKARRMREQLAEAGIEQGKIDAVICPMGLPLGSNHPAEIAVSVAAQLIQKRDELRSASGA